MAVPKPKHVASGSALFHARLDIAMRARGMGQVDLAAKLGRKGNSGIPQWLSGQSKPSLDNAEKLAIALDVDAAWLAFGIGPNPFPVVPLKVPRKRRKK